MRPMANRVSEEVSLWVSEKNAPARCGHPPPSPSHALKSAREGVKCIGRSTPGGAFRLARTVTFTGDTTLVVSEQDIAPGWDELRTWTFTLSDQYTFAMLDADLDALIATVDHTKYPVQTLTPIAYPVDGNPAGASAAMALIPEPYNYPFMDSPPFVSFAGVSYLVPTLAAAAISAYNPTNTGASNGLAGPGMIKLVGWLAMAGDYCLE